MQFYFMIVPENGVIGTEAKYLIIFYNGASGVVLRGDYSYSYSPSVCVYTLKIGVLIANTVAIQYSSAIEVPYGEWLLITIEAKETLYSLELNKYGKTNLTAAGRFTPNRIISNFKSTKYFIYAK